MRPPRRIDHVCLRVRDLDEAAERWAVQFGFTRCRDDGSGRVLLRCGYEPYSLELVEGEPGFDHQAFELPQDVSLDDAAAEIESHGVEVEARDGALFLADLDGTGIELVPYRPAETFWPDVARRTTELHAFRPRKVGHTNFLTGEL